MTTERYIHNRFDFNYCHGMDIEFNSECLHYERSGTVDFIRANFVILITGESINKGLIYKHINIGHNNE